MSRFRRRPFLGVFGPAIHHQSLRVLQLVHLWKTEPDIRRWKWPKLSPILPVITVSIPFHSPVPPSGNCGISGRKGSSMEAGPCITYKKKKRVEPMNKWPPPSRWINMLYASPFACSDMGLFKQIWQSWDIRCVLARILIFEKQKTKKLIFVSSYKWHGSMFMLLFCLNWAYFSVIQLLCDTPSLRDARTHLKIGPPYIHTIRTISVLSMKGSV